MSHRVKEPSANLAEMEVALDEEVNLITFATKHELHGKHLLIGYQTLHFCMSKLKVWSNVKNVSHEWSQKFSAGKKGYACINLVKLNFFI